MEHRWGNRIELRQRVRIRGFNVEGEGILRNCSLSGAFIETTMAIAELTLVHVQIPRGTRCAMTASEMWGFVVRRTAGGVGIEWGEPAEAVASAYQPAILESRSAP